MCGRWVGWYLQICGTKYLYRAVVDGHWIDRRSAFPMSTKLILLSLLISQFSINKMWFIIIGETEVNPNLGWSEVAYEKRFL